MTTIEIAYHCECTAPHVMECMIDDDTMSCVYQ